MRSWLEVDNDIDSGDNTHIDISADLDKIWALSHQIFAHNAWWSYAEKHKARFCRHRLRKKSFPSPYYTVMSMKSIIEEAKNKKEPAIGKLSNKYYSSKIKWPLLSFLV